MNRKVTLIFLAAIILFALAGAFAKIMISLDHNEHMYITAGVLVAQNKILYKDFAYLQMPYLPLLYGSVYKLLNINSYYLLTGKIISFLFLCISAILLFNIGRRILSDITLSLSIVALFLLNTSIIYPSTEVSNYIMPVAFSLAGFHLFNISIDNNQIKPFGIFVAGFFLAVAIGIKLTYATMVIPFVIISLLYPLRNKTTINKSSNIMHVFLPFVAGVVIGLLPVVFYLSDIKAFIFNNLGYHTLNTQWRLDTNYIGAMSLTQKVMYAHDVFFQPNNLILILGILFSFMVVVRKNSPTIKQIIEGAITEGVLLPLMLFLIAIPTALAPTPSFPQYFIMPVSFLFLLMIYSQASKSTLETSIPQTALFNKHTLLILVLISAIYNSPSLGGSISYLLDQNTWSGLYIHDDSLNIRNTLLINGINTNQKIATLSPLYIIESNLPIYPELSTGPFTYRIGDLLSYEEQKHLVITSPNSIWDILDEDKPSAILVGFEGNLEALLIDYAVSRGYKKAEGSFNGWELYIINTGVP